MNKIIASPERTVKRRRKNGLLLKFGINNDQYEAMLEEQNHLCLICNSKDDCGRMLAVDHCHTTGRVRGLLCTNCNTALGLFGDKIELLQKALEYIKRDYTVPDMQDTLGVIERDDAKGWKMLVTTPSGRFPSMWHAGEYYGVNATTVRGWCLENSRYRKEGYSCVKIFASLNEMKELINNEKI